MKTLTKISLATAAAALFTTAVVPATYAGDKAESKVKCMGINACKGQGKCQTAQNACAGQNACKGQGWVFTGSEQECTDKGGTVM